MLAAPGSIVNKDNGGIDFNQIPSYCVGKLHEKCKQFEYLRHSFFKFSLNCIKPTSCLDPTHDLCSYVLVQYAIVVMVRVVVEVCQLGP